MNKSNNTLETTERKVALHRRVKMKKEKVQHPTAIVCIINSRNHNTDTELFGMTLGMQMIAD